MRMTVGYVGSCFRGGLDVTNPFRALSRTSLIAVAFAGSVALLTGCFLFEEDDPQGQTADGGVGQTCSTNNDCGDPLRCAGGFCQAPGSVPTSGPCWSNLDCNADDFCRADGVCAPAGSGGVGDACGTGGECDKNLTCVVAGFSGVCAEAGTGDLDAACTSSSDCLAGLVCGPNDTCLHPSVAYPPFTGVECTEDTGPFRVFFEVPRASTQLSEFFRLPFPNNIRVRTDGSLDMRSFPRPGPAGLGIDLVGIYVEALKDSFADGTINGFSATAPVTFRTSGALDFNTLETGEAGGPAIHYMDITDPNNATDRNRSFGYDGNQGLYRCKSAITLRNSAHEPLVPGNTYAAYITTDIRSTSGETAVQDADFAIVLGSSRPADPDLGHAWDVYQPFRDFLTANAINPNTIAAAAVFTVQDTTGRMQRLADAVESSPLPVLKDLTLCDTGVTSPCDDGESRVCGAANPDFYEIHGRFSVPIYQQGTPPYANPGDGGDILEVGGVPQQVGTEDVCFAMTVPKTVAPPGGFPMLVYAHGTGGTFKGFVTNGTARNLAMMANPTIGISFDGVVHGERRRGNPRDSDSLMFNVINPPAARDNNLQGGVDVLQALRIGQLGTVTLPTAGDVDLNAALVYYLGHSQGSNVGIPAISVSDYTNAPIFSGAGSLLTLGILNKTSPVNAKSALEFLLGEPLSTSHPVMIIWQWYFDASDPVNYGPLLVRNPPAGVSRKHVFMSWGQGDTFSPEPTLNVTAKVIGLPVVNPPVTDIGSGTVTRPVSDNVSAGGEDRTAACFQYQPDGFDGHFVLTRTGKAIADWTAFLNSAMTSGTPNVP